jgi:hypothetical protein
MHRVPKRAIGRRARAAKLTLERRAEIARKAAETRWRKPEPEQAKEPEQHQADQVACTNQASLKSAEPAELEQPQPEPKPLKATWSDGRLEPADPYLRWLYRQRRKSDSFLSLY